MFAVRYNNKTVCVEWSSSAGTWGKGSPPWLALDVVLLAGVPADLWTVFPDPRDSGIEPLATPEEVRRALATCKDGDLAFEAGRAVIALDPLGAALDAVGYPRYSGKPVEICRVSTGCFGTSHLPSQHQRWERRFARWGVPPTRSEALLAADQAPELRAIFGQGPDRDRPAGR